MAAPVILVETHPRRAADGVVETVRLAGAGGTQPYFYNSVHWRAGITKLPTLITELSFDGGDFGAGGVPQAAEIEWGASTLADLATLSSSYMWIDTPVTVRIGPENADGTLPPVVLTGKVLSALPDGALLKITLSDPAADLKKPLITAAYGGTGGLDGPADWAGKVKRRVWGRIWNLQGDCIDTANSIYCFADPLHQLYAIDEVRDKGATAAKLDFLGPQATAAATFAALQNAVAPQGGGVVCPSIACVKWWTTPAGTLTADLRGEIGSGYVETTAEIVERLVSAGPGTPMADGTVAAAVALRPAPVGWVANDESTTVTDMIENLLGSSSLLWLLNAAGEIELHPWGWGNSVASARSMSVKRTSCFAPVGTRKLGFRRNETKMARGDLAGIVLVDDVVFPDGQALSDAIDNAAGTATWDGVTGPGKPQDNATVGAPSGTPVGNSTADDVAAAAGKVPAIETSLAAAKATLDGLGGDIARAETDIANLNADVAASMASAFQASADAASAIGQVTAEVTRAKDAEGVLTATVGSLQTGQDSLSATVAANFLALTNEDEALSASITTLTSNYNGLSSTVAENYATLSDAQSSIATQVSTLQSQADGNTATINAQGVTISSLQDQTASLSSTVTSIYNGLSAAISSEALTRSNADNALSSEIDTLSARVGNNTADITNNQAANASALGALSSVVNGLSASVSIRANLISNPSGGNGTNGWTVYSGSIISNPGYYGEGSQFQAYGQNQNSRPAMYQDFDFVGGYAVSFQAEIFSGEVTMHSGTYLQTRAFIQFKDSAGNLSNAAATLVLQPNHDWTLLKAENITAPSNTVGIRVCVEVWGDGAYDVSNVGWRRLKLERGSVCSLYSDDKTTSTLAASVTTTQSAVATLQSQAASFEQRLSAGSPNQVKNGSAEQGMLYWTPQVGAWVPTVNPYGPNFQYFPGGGGTTGSVYLDSDPISILAQQPYACAINSELGQTGGQTDGLSRLELMWFANSTGTGTPMRHDPGPWLVRPWMGNYAANRAASKLVVTAPAGAVTCRVRLTGTGTQLTYVQFAAVKLEFGSISTPYSQEATVLTQQGAIVDVQGRTQAFFENAVAAGSSRAAVRINANGSTSGIELQADAIRLGSAKAPAIDTDAAGNVRIYGQLQALGTISSASSGARFVLNDQGIKVYDSNNVARVELGKRSS